MNWDAFIEYNQQDVRLTERVAKKWRVLLVRRIKERWGIFWRIVLWLIDRRWIRSPYDTIRHDKMNFKV